MAQPGDRVRARVLLLCFFISILVTLCVMEILWPAWDEVPSPPVASAMFGWVLYGSLLPLLAWAAKRKGIGFRASLGAPPDGVRIRWSVLCGVGLLGLSVFTIYLVFLPLSYLAPDFVRFWLLEGSITMVWERGEGFRLANALSFVDVCLLTPLTEEFLFRGLLLRSWVTKWGLRSAIVASSAIFAVLHTDVLGAFLFAVVVSAAFLRTGTLWIPMVVHATGNAIVWVLALTEILVLGSSSADITDLQSSWWAGALGLVVGLPLLVRAVRRMPQAPGGQVTCGVTDEEKQLTS